MDSDENDAYVQLKNIIFYTYSIKILLFRATHLMGNRPLSSFSNSLCSNHNELDPKYRHTKENTTFVNAIYV